MWEAKSCFYKNFEYISRKQCIQKNISIIDFISQNYAKLQIEYKSTAELLSDWKLVEAQNFCHIGFLRD